MTTLNEYAETALAASRASIMSRLENEILRMQQFQTILEVMRPYAIELPESAEVTHCSGDVYVHIPRSNAAIVRIREQLRALPVDEGFVIEEEDESSSDGRYILILKNLRKFGYFRWVSFIFDATSPKAECRLVQIDTRTVTREVPVYEVICPEGAEEHALDEVS